jgi:hypothetical protein
MSVTMELVITKTESEPTSSRRSLAMIVEAGTKKKALS